MRGGKRPGAGRPKGAATKRTREIADRTVADGETPLEYMLRVMRDATAEPSRRDDMAKAAAPYIHARLSAVVATVGGDLTLRELILRTQQQPGDGAIDVTPRVVEGLRQNPRAREQPPHDRG
jgi:hypothetical protein